MKLAISNIAWEHDQEPALLPRLRESGITGIEIAPTKIWPAWEGVSEASAASYAKALQAQGFTIPALQALLFGRPELQIFDPSTHESFFEHIRLLTGLAAGLGAKVLVWGSPRNRLRKQLSMFEALDRATEFFAKAAQICADQGICIAVEANPVDYHCDFITNVADAGLLVDRVRHNSFQLHMDAGGVHICGGPIGPVIEQAGAFVHFHASEPALAPLAGGVVDHVAAHKALQKIGYAQWVSIEMKKPEDPQLVIKSAQAAVAAYGAAAR